MTRERYQRYLDSFNNRDYNKVLEFWAPQFVVNVQGEVLFDSPEALAAQGIKAIMPMEARGDARHTAVHSLPPGNRALQERHVSGKWAATDTLTNTLGRELPPRPYRSPVSLYIVG